MEKVITAINECKIELEIKLSEEELQPRYQKAYQDAKPHIDLKGFRKGKVPVAVIKQYFGKQIETETQEQIISETFQKIAQEENLQPIGQPAVIKLSRDDGGLQFTIEFETLPNFELVDYKGLTLDEPTHTVSEEEVDAEIEKLVTHNGDLVLADQVTDENFVVGLKLGEVDKETGLPLLGEEPKEIQVYLADDTVLPELRRSVMNLKKGETFRFSPHDSDPQAPDKSYNVTVTEIEKLVPKEFSNEFVKEYTKGKFETTEELRQEIEFKLQDNWDEKARNELDKQVTSKLVEAHDFAVPKTIVDNVLEAMIEDLKKQYKDSPQAASITKENMERDLRPVAERTVKWEIIRNKIIEKENIQVEDYDVDPIIESQADQVKTDKSSLKRNLLQNKNFVSNMLAKKAMDFIHDFAIMNEVDFDEYMERFEGSHSRSHDHDHDHDHDHNHNHNHEDDEPKSNIITP